MGVKTENAVYSKIALFTWNWVKQICCTNRPALFSIKHLSTEPISKKLFELLRFNIERFILIRNRSQILTIELWDYCRHSIFHKRPTNKFPNNLIQLLHDLVWPNWYHGLTKSFFQLKALVNFT